MAEHNEERSYIAFISYRHKELDREAAIALQKKIEHFKVPKEFRDKTGSDRLGFCFRDEDELPTSSSLSDSIRYALDHTQFLIVICSPDLPRSEWCAEEIRYFLSTHDRDHLLAVLVNGEPEESFSPYMTNIYDENGEVIKRIEPLAANITGTPEHFSRAKFKKESIRICAALLGCPFDELWQRERRYQNRRKAIFGAAAFAAMAAFVIVVGAKNLQIRAKNAEISEQNRQITEQNDAISEQNRQITEQNTEISEKNKELQVREGKLLEEAGELLLEDHDLSGAAKNAVAALSIEDVHTEGAEHLLASALGAYSAQSVRLSLAVEQDTVIDRCTMLSDGSFTFTSDRYGMVRAFKDHAEQWSFSSVPTKNRAEYLDDGRTTELYLVENEKVLLVGNAYYVAGLSPKTGEVLWKFPKKKEVNFLAVSPDGTKFAVFNDFADECISIHSCSNGTTICWFYLPEFKFKYMGVELNYGYMFNDYSSGKSFGGCFSADGKYFMFGAEVATSMYEILNDTDAYIEETLDEDELIYSTMDNMEGRTTAEPSEDLQKIKRKDMLAYSVVDLEEKSIQMVGTEPIQTGMNPIFGCSYDPETNELFFVRHDDLDRATYAGVIRSDGDVSYTLKMSDIRLNKNTAPWNYLEGKQKIVASSTNNLYIFNKENGEFTGRYELDQNITACQWLDTENDVLMVVQEDGIYHIYPLNESGNNQYVNIFEDFSLSNLAYASSVGEGIFRWNHEDFVMEGAEGKWLLISADDPQKVMAVDIFTDPNVREITSDNALMKASYCVLSPDGSELYLVTREDEDFSVYLIDPEAGSLRSGCTVKGVTYLVDRPIGIYPGGEKIIFGNQVFSSDGSSEYLEYAEDLEFKSLANHAVIGQSADGTIYTAYIKHTEKKKDQILIWKNDKGLCTFSVHDDTAFLLGSEEIGDGVNGETILLKVGENGQTVAGVRKASDNCFTGYFIVTPEGEASTLDAVAGTLPISLLCPARDNPFFAALETDGVIRIYDPAQEKPLLEITSSDGFAGAVDLCFTASDQYLGVLSYNGEFSLYDKKTGELHFKDANSALATEYGTTDLKLFISKDGKKLICIATETEWVDASNGAVYDLETGELLADIPNVFTYFPESDQVVVFRTASRTRKYFLCPLYDTRKLMDWSEEE